jgi:hypothetical protein
MGKLTSLDGIAGTPHGFSIAYDTPKSDAGWRSWTCKALTDLSLSQVRSSAGFSRTMIDRRHRVIFFGTRAVPSPCTLNRIPNSSSPRLSWNSAPVPVYLPSSRHTSRPSVSLLRITLMLTSSTTFPTILKLVPLRYQLSPKDIFGVLIPYPSPKRSSQTRHSMF